MKVKDLIRFLKDCNPEATVLAQEYTGSQVCLLRIEATYFPKGQKVKCQDSWVSEVDSKTKVAKTDVVTIIGV